MHLVDAVAEIFHGGQLPRDDDRLIVVRQLPLQATGCGIVTGCHSESHHQQWGGSGCNRIFEGKAQVCRLQVNNFLGLGVDALQVKILPRQLHQACNQDLDPEDSIRLPFEQIFSVHLE